MALDAGTVFATLGARFEARGFNQFGVAMLRARDDMDRTERRTRDYSSRTSAALTAMGGAAKTVGTLAAAAGAGGVALLALETLRAAKAAGEFEARMRNVNTIAKLSESGLKALGRTVLEMAGRTGQAPKVLAEGLYDIVSSGFKANDAIKILEASAKAATAGLTDTATSTKAVVAVLNSYHLGADQAGKVSDQLFQIVNAGVITFEELSRQIGDALPFASSLGVGLEQLGGAIATITKGGVPAAQTMTQIKGIFNQMLSPSDALSAAIKKTGSASAESLLKTKGFQGSLEALVGTTDGSKAAVSALFPNVEALGGVLRLTGDNAKGAREDLRSMAEASGSTQAAFAEQSKSYEVAAQKFSAAWDAARITVGQAVLPILTAKLGEWSGALSKAAADGTLDRMAQDVANFADSALTALQGLAQAAPGVLRAIGDSMDFVLGMITGLDDAIVLLLKGLDLIPGIDIDTSQIERGIENINRFRESLREQPATVKVTAEIDNATDALRSIQGTKLESKVMQILASDRSARAKMTAFNRLGIDGKTSIILANISNALGGITTVQGALDRLQTYKRLTVELHRIVTGTDISNPGGLGLTPKPRKGKAAGRGPGGWERALVGEGRGPEWYVDPQRGNAFKVDAPTLMDIAPGAYVIPSEDRYRGRAMDFMAMLAADLGIGAYAKGKKPHFRPSKKQAAKAVRDMPVPERVTYAAVPEDELSNDVDAARGAWKKRDASITSYEKKLRTADAKVAKLKGKKGEKDARRDRDRIRNHLNALRHGGQGLSSAQDLYNEWQQDSSLLKKLQASNREIERQNTIQETARTRMANAARAGDEAGYGVAQKDRNTALGILKTTYEKAVKLAKSGSTIQAELEGKLATLIGDLQDSGQPFEASTAETEADRIADSGLTDAERARLATLNKDIALAALTQGLEDDTGAAGAKANFLQGVLDELTSGRRPVGDTVVGDIADQLKSARDNLTALQTGGASGSVDNPDLQAQLDRERQLNQGLADEARINRQALEVFGGAGDIGSGGANAIAAAGGGNTIVFQSYVPPSPQEAARLAGYTVGGLDAQGNRQSPRQDLGL